MSPPDEQGPFRAWAVSLLLPLAAVGLFAGVYMTRHHEVQAYGSAELQGELIGCVESAKVSCDIVNTSAWSELFGVPQFTWAIPMYVLIAVLAVWAIVRRDRSALWLILGLGLFNAAYSVLLAYISIVELDKLCTWCLRLYAINFATPILAAIGGVRGAPIPGKKVLGLAFAVYVMTAAGAIGGQRTYRAELLGDAPATEVALPSDAQVEEATTAADPEADAPALSWQVTTEDKNPATLRIDPSDAWKGAADAKVAVVEFADLECGYCKRASGQLKRLHEAYGDRVAFVFKHFPMDPACNPGVNNKKHRSACRAAMGAVCAQEQGRFWAFHDVTFKNQHKLKKDDLRRYAEVAGVDLPAWDACMQGPDALAKVKADAAHGAELDLHGTPRIWIDGKLYRAGTSAEQMARALEVALGSTAADATEAARAMAEPVLQARPIPSDVPPTTAIEADGLVFTIDTFEAGLSSDGAATSGKHQVPAIRMSWYAARDACNAAGKRMCTEEEWITACQGQRAHDDDGNGFFADDLIEGDAYPYADYHQRGRCWDDHADLRPVYTGEMPGCVSGFGVYDLTGNVEEWVGATPETAVLLGGAYDTTKDFARCYRRNDTFGPGLANPRTGFRCCQ